MDRIEMMQLRAGDGHCRAVSALQNGRLVCAYSHQYRGHIGSTMSGGGVCESLLTWMSCLGLWMGAKAEL